MKVFDFGLATEITPTKACDDGTYKLTGCTGSLLYMAPEVAQCFPYNLTADSYSFGILLWQIMAMKSPYGKITSSVLQESVVKGNTRPKIDDSWSKELSSLMQACWSSKWTDRPTFDSIEENLNTQYYAGFGSRGSSNLDVSRSSYHNILNANLRL